MRLRRVWLPVLVAVGFGAPSAMADPVGPHSEFPDGLAGVKVSIAAGPDGNVWFTDVGANRTRRITPNGASTEFPTCHECRSLTRARLHGGLSFTNVGGDKIGRITPKGTITEFPTAVELSFRAS